MSVPRHARTRKRHLLLGRSFTRLQTGFTLASSGDGFALGAVPLLAVVVDPHPLAVSTVVTADLVPWIVMAGPAGALADRFVKGLVMSVSNATRAAVLLAAAFLVSTHRIDLVLLICAVLLNSACRAVYYSALQATIPQMVPRESLERANGILTGTEAAAEHVAGPVVGAASFAALRALPFFADAAAMVLSSVSVIKLDRSSERCESPNRGSIWGGARLLWGDRRLRLLLFTLSSLCGLQGLVAGILVLVATRDWGVHPGAYGLFLAAGAIGTVPGALMVERLVSRVGSAVTLISSAVVLSGAYLVMATSHTWVMAGAAFMVTGFGIGASSVVATSMRQRLTPQELMGRVGSAWRGVVWGAAPVGALAAGSLAVLGGLRLPIFLAGALQLLVIAVLARPLLHVLPEAGSTEAEAGAEAQDEALQPPRVLA